MECVGKAVHLHGGQTIGVIPRIIEQGGRVSDYVDISIACDNLSDRKELMNTQCDIAVALPGGIGTLDEIFTLAASATIGYHNKRVVLFNIKGFWDALLHLLDHLQAQGMIRGNYRQTIVVANSVDEFFQLLQQTD